MIIVIMSKILIPLLILLVLVSTSSQGCALIKTTNNHFSFSRNTPHDSILISHDDDFTYENGVVNGTGIFNDPYMISGWQIENITVLGESSNITKYFEITNCSVTGSIFIGHIEDSRCKAIDNCCISPTFSTGIYAAYINNMTGLIHNSNREENA